MDQGRVFAPSGGRGALFAGRTPLGDDGSVGRLEEARDCILQRRKPGRKKGISSYQESAHQLPCGIAVPIAGSGRIRPKDAQVRWRLSHGLETFLPNTFQLRRETPSLQRDLLRSDDAAKQPPRLHPAPRQAPNVW